ncbi:hypothetical protein [Mongoliitalea daihaiensis]|uniref:hypothetical protein n=1 Tax=Mongoliitalea daihaiensis TaxID=2782006 RepID=UPI001F398BF6|nr:hypothetical protein [Mongoliitalea daihaiensis]UJP65353.1 hypothetical protein IPZ59_01615 [Mongoliitalea daihaiensis]
METDEIDITDNFIGMIKNLSKKVKLDLIDQISASISENPENLGNDTWKKLYGAFESDKSAEEIIDELRSSRYTSRKVEDL